MARNRTIPPILNYGGGEGDKSCNTSEALRYWISKERNTRSGVWADIDHPIFESR